MSRVANEPTRLIRISAVLWTRLALHLYPSGVEERKRVHGIGALIEHILREWCDEKGIP